MDDWVETLEARIENRLACISMKLAGIKMRDSCDSDAVDECRDCLVEIVEFRRSIRVLREAELVCQKHELKS